MYLPTQLPKKKNKTISENVVCIVILLLVLYVEYIQLQIKYSIKPVVDCYILYV